MSIYGDYAATVISKQRGKDLRDEARRAVMAEEATNGSRRGRRGLRGQPGRGRRGARSASGRARAV
ncbi:hypothetical protein CLV30_102110 [Haloactinopolyspora alba]|uniref:Uncharacterized protein n=1 Tax=Haloactinopolyspora alba TaxID=648780 RepID=A0A2P8EB75_9ACTN|nr:hypothetical protein [Haloactinopolyspora alba]PSL06724.1 hypothetical protein CLV30_102110 [Haloactinopolyspora alba]